MPRGAPDYSNVSAANPLHRVDDMAELAARLGSPATHDRAGSVVFIETFRWGIGSWQKAGSGTGRAETIESDQFRSGPFSCKLTAGEEEDSTSQIFRKFPYPVLNRYGLEFSARIGADTGDLTWALAYHDGTDEHSYMMKYVVADEEVLIRGADGTYSVLLTDVVLVFGYAPFHVVKMVVDLENDTFYRLIINEASYNISDYPAYIFEEDDSPNVRVAIQQRTAAVANPSTYIDDIILTQNEP